MERILQPSPFVRWLWAEHRGFFMAFVCAVAPPIVALGGLLLTFLIRELHTTPLAVGLMAGSGPRKARCGTAYTVPTASVHAQSKGPATCMRTGERAA